MFLNFNNFILPFNRQSICDSFINLVAYQQRIGKKYFVLLLLIVLGVTACKKGASPHVGPVTPSNTTTPTTVTPPGVDVYLAGTTTAEYPNNFPLATYWKNGVPVVLANSLSNFNSEAFGIAIHGADICVAGNTHVGNHNTATYWKNGQAVNLADGESGAFAIAVNGDDIYIAGSVMPMLGNKEATYWKNGTATMIPPATGTISTEANSIALSGNDIFMAGITYDANKGYTQATYWKNGIATILANNASGSVATGIAVSGTDTYVVGQVNTIATIWKNSVAADLTGGSKYSAANSIAINGADVYVAGYIDYTAAFWKNGKPTMLTYGAPVSPGTLPSAVALNGKDVFVSGGYSTAAGNGSGNVIYWFNGSPIELPIGNAHANTITVVSK